MEMIGAWGGVIIWLVCSVVVWRIYHKLFQVHYFNVGAGIVKEILGSLFVGGILAALIVRFLPLALIIIAVVVVLVIVKKNRS